MVDFDPGMFSKDDMDDSYEEGYETSQDELSEELNQEEPEDSDDSDLNAVDLAATAGFGYHMAQDDLEERKLAEDLLDRKNKEPKKVSLKSRRRVKYKGTPAQRWMFEVASGDKTTKDPLEYTDKEKEAILKHEGEHDFKW